MTTSDSTRNCLKNIAQVEVEGAFNADQISMSHRIAISHVSAAGYIKKIEKRHYTLTSQGRRYIKQQKLLEED